MIEYLRRLNEALPAVPTEYILAGYAAWLLLAWVIRWRPRCLVKLLSVFWLVRTVAFWVAGK